MKKRINKLTLLAIGALLLLTTALPLTANAAQEKPIAKVQATIKLDGKDIKTDSVREIAGRMYLPVAQLSMMFGAQVNWNQDNEEATITTVYGDRILLGNGVPVVYFNGARYIMDAAPFTSDGRMYIPLRDGAEMLHAKVSWNDEEQIVSLESVPLSVATEQFGLTEIVKQAGVSQANLLKRNGLNPEDGVEAGAKLRVVMPSILSHEAKPFTEAEWLLLAKITQVEVGDESYESQLAVANVILNRVKDSRFPDTVRDVVYSGKQFPPAHNGLLDKSVPKANALRAAKDALNGKNNVGDAVYFFNPRVTKGKFWSSLTVIDTIGSHRYAK
ncbi:cell wall hydrolase [Cohnella endophytica]|uniref:Cell wall hydrolase n=1 Tax=Cohnella endophytica TaxID=2419778 RepID=A0A494XBM1_9BACL|nr:cell wall hydrolase [Cohnella endophytica]RKP47918.1 cell wall hydrolase [Cohnella endophytica]